VRAARLAVAHDFISELPQGYETNAGERGTALSGGQRQRIALARLFLSNSPILVLDEATSALDSETEQQVLQNLQQIAHNRTMFLIAHRFAPLKKADLILVMEKGVIAEKGTHEGSVLVALPTPTSIGLINNLLLLKKKLGGILTL
jgi:ATP-binding cassette subfamily B protein